MADLARTLSITEARKRIFDLVERTQTPGVHFTLTENGRARSVLMSVEDFEGWVETLDVMMEMPNLRNEIAQARKEFAEGKFITLQELKKKYEISDRPRSKRSKRVR